MADDTTPQTPTAQTPDTDTDTDAWKKLGDLIEKKVDAVWERRSQKPSGQSGSASEAGTETQTPGQKAKSFLEKLITG